MLEQGMIEPSDSSWASPIVQVKKKDRSLRFCVDLCKLNFVTRKDSYPLPRIDELLDSLNQSRYSTTLELQSGFWQIALDEDAKAKTAFTSHLGLYQFTKMPFGLTSGNLPAVDDVIMYSKLDVFQHLYDILVELWVIHDAGLKFKGTTMVTCMPRNDHRILEGSIMNGD